MQKARLGVTEVRNREHSTGIKTAYQARLFEAALHIADLDNDLSVVATLFVVSSPNDPAPGWALTIARDDVDVSWLEKLLWGSTTYIGAGSLLKNIEIAVQQSIPNQYRSSNFESVVEITERDAFIRGPLWLISTKWGELSRAFVPLKHHQSIK